MVNKVTFVGFRGGDHAPVGSALLSYIFAYALQRRQLLKTKIYRSWALMI